MRRRRKKNKEDGGQERGRVMGVLRPGWKKEEMRFRGKQVEEKSECFPVKEASVCQPQASPQIPLPQA